MEREFGEGISKGRAARVPPFPLAARLPSVKGNPLPCPPTNCDGGSRIRISVPLSDKTRGSPRTCALSPCGTDALALLVDWGFELVRVPVSDSWWSRI